MLISNTDAHLRNHGWLRLKPQGWTFSPLFDVASGPERPDCHSLLLDEESAFSSVDRVLILSGVGTAALAVGGH